MSYEGYSEWLCKRGHYHVTDCHESGPERCPRCTAPVTHWHAVDQTNGTVEGDPSTQPAPKRQVNIEDEWKRDRHGNRYAVSVPLFKPGKEWRERMATQ